MRFIKPHLVGADGSGSSHCLAGREMPHKVLVDEHLLHRVGEGNGDCQGQALGHGHDDNGDGIEEELKGYKRVVSTRDLT
jgi:hypothetical protein